MQLQTGSLSKKSPLGSRSPQSKGKRKPLHFANTDNQLLVALESLADTEHMAIGMAKVHLADVPRHIGRRKCHLKPGGDTVLVHFFHVVHPDRHPDSLVAFFVSALLKRGGIRTTAAASLRPLTKKDASFLTR